MAVHGGIWEDQRRPEVSCAVQNYWKKFEKMVGVCYLGMLEVAERKLAA